MVAGFAIRISLVEFTWALVQQWLVCTRAQGLIWCLSFQLFCACVMLGYKKAEDRVASWFLASALLALAQHMVHMERSTVERAHTAVHITATRDWQGWGMGAFGLRSPCC